MGATTGFSLEVAVALAVSLLGVDAAALLACPIAGSTVTGVTSVGMGPPVAVEVSANCDEWKLGTSPGTPVGLAIGLSLGELAKLVVGRSLRLGPTVSICAADGIPATTVGMPTVTAALGV